MSGRTDEQDLLCRHMEMDGGRRLHIEASVTFGMLKTLTDFLEAQMEQKKRYEQVTVDLAGAPYLNSFFFGVLLLLREVSAAPVKLMDPNPTTLESLKKAKLDKLFEIGFQS
ncbi:hypothetical protein [Magnetofaba australis]|nr:hypothetical protein [Magnetofaba australis]